MDTLPQDIIDEIISSLLPEDWEPSDPYNQRRKWRLLSPLATLSPLFQAAVERMTFKYIKINSDEISEFKKLFTRSRRLYLSKLTFTVILPSYDSVAALRAESPDEWKANDESYTDATLSLFQILKSWELEDPGLVNYRLTLCINHPESPSDTHWPHPYVPWNGNGNEEEAIYEGRFLHSFIDFTRPELLPTLHRVERFVMLQQPEKRYGYRNVYPKVPILLASKMPNVRVIRLCMDDDENRFPDLRRRNRDELGEAIRQLSLPEVEEAIFHFYMRKYRNEKILPPVLCDPRTGDSLGSAIYSFSHNLVGLRIVGVFDSSVFRSLEGLRETQWPRLKTFITELHESTPSGDWYLIDKDGISIASSRLTSPMSRVNIHNEQFNFTEEARYAHMHPINIFRKLPNEKTLAPVVEAYVDALSVMPKIHTACLSVLIQDGDEEDEEEVDLFTITYLGPCHNAKNYPPRKICPSCDHTATRRLVTCFMGWKPTDELAAKLYGIQDAFRTEPMVVQDYLDHMREREANED